MAGVGSFVVANSNADGVGKVVETDGNFTEVAYFESPVGPRLHRVRAPSSRVQEVELVPQTLVYCLRGAAWRTGRIVTGEIAASALQTRVRSGDEPHYGVRFPGVPLEYLPRSAVFVRGHRGDDDPTELLAAQTTESAFFTEARRALGSFAARQRASLRGLTAISSSRIELHRHQLAAVRRILLDPVQRYLLADEVGLGKTIEAGLLIRQHLIDDGPPARVLIVVPDHIVPQWEGELASRFGIAEDERVVLISFSDLDGGQRWPNPTMVVVDEAHHAAEWAYADDSSRYELLETLARRSPKILLLSGTPVLHHEDGFLAILHLLDPDAYSLNDRDRFRAQVAARDDVADALVDLSDDAAAVFLRPAIARLCGGAFSEDPDLAIASTRVLELAGASAGDPTRVEAIRHLRNYLVERYRFYRRIVRTHRSDRSLRNLLPRRTGLVEIPVMSEDSRREAGAELLGEWRDNVRADALATDSAEAPVFAGLVEASLSHPSALTSTVVTRAQALRAGRLPAAFDAEEDWLCHWTNRLGDYESPDVRTVAVGRFLNEPQFRKRRAVVFVDDPSVASEISKSLNDLLPKTRAVFLLGSEDPDVLLNFSETSDAVLVCDRHGEDGLNLQHGQTTIVFFDVPLDFGRIEQRIGRADRLEGMTKLCVHIVCPVGSYEKAWVGLLREVVRIFDRSVAPLQYVLSAALQVLRLRLLGDGPQAALAEVASAMTDPAKGLEAELKRIARQEILDAPDWDEEEEQMFIERIEAAREESMSTARAALGPWLACIRMECRATPPFVRYIHHGMESRGRQTLVPIGEFLPELLPYVGRGEATDRGQVAFGPFSFDEQNVDDEDLLLHLSHPFFATVLAAMERDDRGRAWGIWRLSPNRQSHPDIFVRFDFRISVDLRWVQPLVDAYGTLPSLRRRADAALPVEHRVVWIDRYGSLVTALEVLTELNQPYRPAKQGGPDLNLRPERWSLALELGDLSDWQALVIELRRRAEAAVRLDREFVARCATAAAKIEGDTERTVAILRARESLLDGPRRAVASAEISREQDFANAMCQGTREPSLRVDSAGAMFICSSPLQ
jgi:ATP-dependent helicase HepA